MQHLAVLFQHGAFDHAGLFQHQRERGSRVLNELFALFRKASPGQAAAIDQLGPVGLLQPALCNGGIQSVFFEIVKLDRDVMLRQPVARFFNGGTVGNTIQLHLGSFRLSLMPAKSAFGVELFWAAWLEENTGTFWVSVRSEKSTNEDKL